MEKGKIKKVVKKLTAGVALFTMLSSYVPAVTNIVMAVEEVVEDNNSTTEEFVEITNSVIKEMLLATYDYDRDGKLSTTEVASVTTLDLVDEEDKLITDISDLEKLTNLTQLNIFSSSLADISTIGTLKELRNLNLNLNEHNITDVSFLRELTKLETLLINGSSFKCNSILEYLNPETITRMAIYASSMDVKPNLEQIADFQKLVDLTLECTDLTSLDEIAKIPSIEYLNLENNKIKDITPLEDMPNLKSINLRFNEIDDYTVVENKDYEANLGYQCISRSIVDQNFSTEAIEIDLPKSFIKAFSLEGSQLIQLNVTDNGNYLSTEVNLNEEKTKLIVAPENTYGKRTVEMRMSNPNYFEMIDCSFVVEYERKSSADNTQEIVIENERLKQYFLESYDRDGDGIITAYDMDNINSFRFYNSYDIEVDVQCLRYCKNLNSISLEGTFKNLEVLKEIPNLNEIRLIGSNNDIAWIEEMPNLTELDLVDIDVSNVNWNSVSDKLWYLRLSNASISNIEFITRFANLVSLDIANNEIEDITPLKQLNKLSSLTITLVESNFDTIEELEINNLYCTQNVKIDDKLIEKGTTLEIEVPTIMKKMLDPNSKLYYNRNVNGVGTNNTINTSNDSNSWSSNSYDQITKVNVSFNQDKTKIIMDATNSTVGSFNEKVTATSTNGIATAHISIKGRVEQPTEKTEIDIKDTNFKKYLLKNYDIDKDQKITKYDMLQINNMYLEFDSKIEDLSGIEYAKNITSLTIANYNCNNIIGINELPLLKTLRLNGASAGKLQDITILNNLESISINYPSSKVNYDCISGLTNLKQLEIYDSDSTDAIDLNKFERLVNLEKLTVNSRVSNPEVLANLTKLKSLQLRTKDGVSNIEFISNLVNITDLNLEDNLINDITPLRNLTNLRYVNLYKNPINTKEQETARTLEILRERQVSISIVETNITSNIEFKDANFKQSLLDSGADLNKDNQISIDEMQRVYSVTLKGDKISSIEEIENATVLSSIYIYTEVEDLTPILKLPQLRYIYAYTNKLSKESTQTILNVNKLEHLSIYDTYLTNLEQLNNLTLLQELKINTDYMNSDRILSLNGIENLTELNTLEIYGKIKDIEALRNLPKLKTLSVRNQIYNENEELLTNKEILGFIKTLNLERLNFGFNGPSPQIDLGNFIVGSEVKKDITELDDIIKELYTPESILYSDDLKVQCYNNENITINERELAINTSNVGEGYASINFYSNRFSGSFMLKWRNIIQGDTTKVITIPDKNLEKVLLENYDIDGDKKITNHDIINISDLDITNKGISNLEGLQYAINMTSIYAAYNDITNISSIANLTKLTYAEFANNIITDISILNNVKWPEDCFVSFAWNYINFENNNANYMALKDYMYSREDHYQGDIETELQSNIRGQSIGDINKRNTPITNMDEKLKAKLIRLGLDVNKDNEITPKELQFAGQILYELDIDSYNLDLSNLNIVSISGLEYLNITEINLSGNNIVDITPIINNNYIYNLNLSNNNITNISGIDKCYTLSILNLSNNNITNITPITTLRNMQEKDPWNRYVEIDLSNNQISNISCIKDWKNASEINLSNNKITDISELKNYNFMVGKDYEGNDAEYAENLTINLSGNEINMSNAGNRQTKELFDQKGAKLLLEDKSIATVYVINSNGYYSSDSTAEIVHTELDEEKEYEFVPETDRKYYPANSDVNLAGIFINTVHYNSDATHADKLKQEGYDIEIVITGAIKTKEALATNSILTTTLKVPQGYIGNEAKASNSNITVDSFNRNTITVKLKLKANSENPLYYEIEGAVYLKVKEQVITDVANKTEIIEALEKEQNVTLDMKEEVKEVEKEVFGKLAEKDNVELKVETQKAVWTFNSDTITKPEITVNPTVTLSDTRFENMEEAPSEDGIFIKFEHEGLLPGKAEIELDIKDCASKYENGKTVYLYYYNSDTKKYEFISTVTSNDSKVKIMLEHCSEYFITDEKLPIDGMLGDTDGNDKITTKDAKMVLQHIVKKITLTDEQFARADADRNGKITTKDAKMILQHIVKKIDLSKM